MPETLFLDTNAHSYLFGHPKFSDAQLSELRLRLEARVRSGSIGVLLPYLVLEEMAGAFEESHYEDMVNLAFRLAGWRILRNVPERRFLELAVRRRLRDSECFYEGTLAHSVLVAMMNPRAAAALTARARDVKAAGRRVSTERKAESILALDEKFAADHPGEPEQRGTSRRKWLAQITTEFAAREQMVSDWCLQEMRLTAEEHGLALDDESAPSPRDLPTFWFAESRLAADLERVILGDGSTTSEKQPDIFDWMHFDDCAYADVLVTEDRRFRTLATKSGVPLRVLSFTDWATAILA